MLFARQPTESGQTGSSQFSQLRKKSKFEKVRVAKIAGYEKQNIVLEIFAQNGNFVVPAAFAKKDNISTKRTKKTSR
jgi:hypothetical protein